MAGNVIIPEDFATGDFTQTGSGLTAATGHDHTGDEGSGLGETTATVVALPAHAAQPAHVATAKATTSRRRLGAHRSRVGMLARTAIIDGRCWHYGISTTAPDFARLLDAPRSTDRGSNTQPNAHAPAHAPAHAGAPRATGAHASPGHDGAIGAGNATRANNTTGAANGLEEGALADDQVEAAGTITSIVEGSFGIGYPPNPDPDPLGIWAVNLHGYFAGGRAYWRESSLLASTFGWNVLNPSLPGFGGTAPLPKDDLSIEAMAHGVASLLDHLEIDKALMIGHSMGGAVAVKFAHDFPERTLGVIYRDGIATPAWKHRKGIIATLGSPILSEMSDLADIAAAAVLDLPDLLVGNIGRTARSLLPDTGRNMLMLREAFEVAFMLYATDLSDEVVALGRQPDLPVLPIWGCFDRVSTARTAKQFEGLSGRHLLWVPGGHSWMLARPSGQVEILRWHPRGREFLSGVIARLGA